MESVMETLRKMDELAISPDYNTFNILIKYFCRKNMYLLAYRTMEDMNSKGYQPAEVHYFINILMCLYEILEWLNLSSSVCDCNMSFYDL
jgi:pentatricopeptide repeat protein